MLAVQPAAQGQGLGRRLKAYQRSCLLALGIEVACWTYDPLVAANAHLNLNRLGARATQYLPDLYGAPRSTKRSPVAWPSIPP
jgi:predicted GNAT superfamily acetyltransferase